MSEDQFDRELHAARLVKANARGGLRSNNHHRTEEEAAALKAKGFLPKAQREAMTLMDQVVRSDTDEIKR